MLMKKNFYFLSRKRGRYSVGGFFLFFSVFVFILFSCHKEADVILEEEVSSDVQLQIQAAKERFEQEYFLPGQQTDSIPLLTPASARWKKKSLIKAKPNWDKAKLGVDEVVEIPLQTLGQISYASEKTASDAQLRSCITRMIIVKDGGERIPAFMHIRADSNYLATKGYDLSKNAYKKMKKDFSGVVFYTYLDGRFSNGWRYKDGDIIATISYDSTMTTPDIETAAIPVQKAMSCVTHIEVEYFRWCWGYEEKGVVFTTGCEDWRVVGTYRWTECVNEDGSGFGGGLVIGGGGGGGRSGGEGSTTPPTRYSVTVNAGPGGMAIGGGTFTEGATCTIVATPNAGYVFEKWDGPDIFSQSVSTSFIVTKNTSVTAYFKSSSTDPCGQLKGVKGNTTANNSLTTLKADAMNSSSKNESAYIQLNRNGVRSAQYVPGLSDRVNVKLSPSDRLEWVFHVHHVFNGQMFSAGDIWILYSIYNNQTCTNWATFQFGLVTHKGEAYVLTISDWGMFKNFIKNNKITGPKNQWGIDLEEDMKMNRSQSEQIFLDRIANSGLSMMKKDLNSSNDAWKMLEYNSNSKTITTKPCN